MKCSECKYCEGVARTTKQFNMPYGRKIYYCNHPKALKIMINKFGYPNIFIGYGDMTYESPLQLKGCKRNCPLKKESNICPK